MINTFAAHSIRFWSHFYWSNNLLANVDTSNSLDSCLLIIIIIAFIEKSLKIGWMLPGHNKHDQYSRRWFYSNYIWRETVQMQYFFGHVLQRSLIFIFDGWMIR